MHVLNNSFTVSNFLQKHLKYIIDMNYDIFVLVKHISIVSRIPIDVLTTYTNPTCSVVLCLSECIRLPKIMVLQMFAYCRLLTSCFSGMGHADPRRPTS